VAANLLQVAKVGSGRLTLLLDEPFPRRSWSDRTRCALDDKLGAAFVELERRLTEAEEKRRRREEDLLRRQHAGDASVPTAKRAYITDLNRRRLLGQVSKYVEAQSLRAYAEGLQRTANSQDDRDAGEAIHRWAAWAQAEADRVDPLIAISALVCMEPDEIRPADFDRFMPPGMSAYRRPTS
jgi:hypothetical protein